MRLTKDYIYWGLVLIIALSSFLLIRRYLTPLIFAAVFAYLLAPLYRKSQRILKAKNFSAATFTILLLFLMLFLILWGSWGVAQQSAILWQEVHSADFDFDLRSLLPENLAQLFQDYSLDLKNLIEQGLGGLIRYFSNILREQTINFLVSAFIFSVSFFYFLRDGPIILEALDKHLPLPEKSKTTLFQSTKMYIDALLYSQLIIGVLQAVLGIIGYYILKMPGALLAGLLIFIFAIFPIGPVVVYVPTALFAIIQGRIFEGIVLLIYGIVIISSVDNVIKPYILGRKAQIHPLVLIIGLIGGVTLFGISGIVLGPLILTFFFAIIKELEPVDGQTKPVQ